jgi:S1-C subfamily serine protease
VGFDPATDLALLRPSSQAPATLAFGGDDGLSAGSWVIALGSSDGVFNAASVGVLSARGLVPGGKLPAQRLVDALFIDSGLGAGGSGGPVLDLEGRVIGVSLAMLGGSRGLGVVLPSSLAASTVKDLEHARQSAHGFAGLTVADEADPGRRSVRVTAVEPGGPADQAQIRPGDRISTLDGHPLQGARALRLHLFTTPPGASVAFGLVRGTERVATTLRLETLPAAAQWSR